MRDPRLKPGDNRLWKDALGGRKPRFAEDADAAVETGAELEFEVKDDTDENHWDGGPHIHIEKIKPRHIPAKRN